LALDNGYASRFVIFIAPLVFIFAFVALKWTAPLLYWKLVAREDSPVEYLTSLVYFVAFVAALAIQRRFHQQRQHFYALLYLLLALGFLFICLEEVSWGQRILGVSSPEAFEEYNRQGEINLHNFAGRYALHAAYILVGAYGAFAHLFIPQRLPKRSKRVSLLFIPDALLFFYFFAVFALYTYYDYLSPLLVALFGPQFGWEFGRGGERFMIAKDQEAAELLLAIGFLLFVERNRRRQQIGRFRDLPRPAFRLGQFHPQS
jgi:hypothetical protein